MSEDASWVFTNFAILSQDTYATKAFTYILQPKSTLSAIIYISPTYFTGKVLVKKCVPLGLLKTRYPCKSGFSNSISVEIDCRSSTLCNLINQTANDKNMRKQKSQLELTISGPNSQNAVRESARVKGMVKLQRRRSLIAKLITKIFLGVLIACK